MKIFLKSRYVSQRDTRYECRYEKSHVARSEYEDQSIRDECKERRPRMPTFDEYASP